MVLVSLETSKNTAMGRWNEASVFAPFLGFASRGFGWICQQGVRALRVPEQGQRPREVLHQRPHIWPK